MDDWLDNEKCSSSPDGKGPHIPDWDTISINHDGDEVYIDISCSECGCSGCVGKMSTLEEDINW
jgi:hypothetical protein